MIRYRVKLNGEWVDADYGIQLSHDRLAYWVGQYRGIAKRGEYRLHPDTINSREFKNACWQSLTNTERGEAETRKASKPNKRSRHVQAY